MSLPNAESAFRGASASVPPDLDDDLHASSSDESDNSEEDEDYGIMTNNQSHLKYD